MPIELNISATLNVFRLLSKPSLCLPHATISTFNQLPVPLNLAFGKYTNVDIRAVVLDKDNCFAVPHENEVHGAYKEKFAELRAAYPSRKLLIVSNTAGSSSDPSLALSSAVQKSTGVHVLPHRTKKPGCGSEIMDYFLAHPETGVTRPEHVAIVGDRLTTDVMTANLMGGYAMWVRDGVIKREETSVFARMEQRFGNFLLRRGYGAPDPAKNPFNS